MKLRQRLKSTGQCACSPNCAADMSSKHACPSCGLQKRSLAWACYVSNKLCNMCANETLATRASGDARQAECKKRTRRSKEVPIKKVHARTSSQDSRGTAQIYVVPFPAISPELAPSAEISPPNKSGKRNNVHPGAHCSRDQTSDQAGSAPSSFYVDRNCAPLASAPLDEAAQLATISQTLTQNEKAGARLESFRNRDNNVKALTAEQYEAEIMAFAIEAREMARRGESIWTLSRTPGPPLVEPMGEYLKYFVNDSEIEDEYEEDDQSEDDKSEDEIRADAEISSQYAGDDHASGRDRRLSGGARAGR